jgi:hypothetical protein
MGEVGVDPERLAELAGALEQLRDTLAANVPVIVNTLNSYWSGGTGSPVNLGPLKQALGRAPGDAVDMKTRARLAALWEQQQVSLASSGMVNIPFDVRAVDFADAKAEAQALAAAEASKDPKAAMAAIQAIQQDIQVHLNAGDTKWLIAFYNQGAAQVAGLAATLHNLSGLANEPLPEQLRVFTSQDTQILNTYAQGLAAVDKAGKLQQSAISQFTQTPALWSTAMLLKYGPPGSAYGTKDPASNSQGFLAQMTTAVYQAEQGGKLQIPLGGKYPFPAQAYNQVNQALAAYDPLATLLQRDAENKTAAMQVLGGPEGSQIASYLLNGGGLRYTCNNFSDPPGKYLTAVSLTSPVNGMLEVYETGIPYQSIGSFLDAATSAPRGHTPAAFQSATAAYNIISNTPAPLTSSTGFDWQVSAPVRQALLDTYARYLPDLAAEVNAGVPRPPVMQYGKDQPYVIGAGQGQLSAFFQEIAADPKDFVHMQAMSGLAMGSSVGLLAKGVDPPGLSNPVQSFAALYSRVSTEAANVHISQAQQEDLRNQELNSMISLAEAGFGVIPGGGQVMTSAKALASVSAPLIPQFSTSNEQNAVVSANTAAGRDQLMAQIPLVRGLMQTGVLSGPPPPGAFDAKGNPTAAFGAWWSQPGSGEVVAGKTLADWLTTIQVAMGVQHNAFGSN